jgi:hypothetical protein
MAVTHPAEADWSPARLIPTTGIGQGKERERRATEALLSVIHAVPEFGHAILRHAGAPRGRRVQTYVEVRLPEAEARLRPDGAAVVYARRAGRWSCLIEVKTGGDQLRSEQVEAYLDLGLAAGFDAVLTISNEITASPDVSPVVLPPRRGRLPRRYPSLFHLSWWRILAEAVVQHEYRGISDPDQAWILGELIAYLDDERAGTSGFDDMGPSWVSVREGARNQTLDATSADVMGVATRWDQFVEYMALGLYRDLGRRVEVAKGRNESEGERIDGHAHGLAAQATLRAQLKVTDAAAPLDIAADLRGQKVFTTIEVPAPLERKRATARVNWLIRQLQKAEARDLFVEAVYPRRIVTTAPLVAVRDDPALLAHPSDARAAPRRLKVIMRRDLAIRRGKGANTFVGETKRQVVDFYREVVQGLSAPTKRPPQLPESDGDAPKEPSPTPPDFSDSTAREAGEGEAPPLG